MELSLNSNPVARKQLFRANCVRRLPTLKFIDGREVTYEERERVELMFVSEHPSVTTEVVVDRSGKGILTGLLGADGNFFSVGIGGALYVEGLTLTGAYYTGPGGVVRVFLFFSILHHPFLIILFFFFSFSFFLHSGECQW